MPFFPSFVSILNQSVQLVPLILIYILILCPCTSCVCHVFFHVQEKVPALMPNFMALGKVPLQEPNAGLAKCHWKSSCPTSWLWAKCHSKSQLQKWQSAIGRAKCKSGKVPLEEPKEGLAKCHSQSSSHC